jgi:hypothetical protein
MRRRVLIAAPLVALTLVSAGIARDPRSEQVRLTAADIALAERIALKAGDLGAGWTKRPFPAGEGRMQCPEFNPNFSAFTITGKAGTAFSDRSSAQVISAVEVYKSRQQAIGDFKLGARPQFLKCLRRDLNRQFDASGLPIKVTSARVVAAPSVGENRIAYRVVAGVNTGATKANIYADIVAFQRGRSVALLSFMSPFKPYPREAKVAAAVASRMR